MNAMSRPVATLVAAAIGGAAEADAWATRAARVIDVGDATVMPGLIDAHTHLLYLEDPKNGGALEGVKAVTMEGTPLRTHCTMLSISP